MDLKIATEADSATLVEFLLDFYEESIYSDLYEVNVDKALAIIDHWVNDPNSDILWVEGAGAIGVSLTQSWFSDDTFAVEHFWYVHADHRKTQTGLFLLRCAEEWAKQMGACSLHMSTNKNTHPGVSAFLEADGYTEVETSVVKEF